jgi:tol-pal system protein YbgF
MRLGVTLCTLICALAPVLSLGADQRLSDLLLQIQRLQQEVQQLRGRMEVQQYLISTLEKQQRDQYMDLDARLRSLSENAPSRASSTGAAGASSEASAVALKPLGAEKQAYSIAFDLLKQRRYKDAAAAFEDLLARYPNGEFADNAHYWLGETDYVMHDYSAALTRFQRVLANYPLSPKVPASMLKIGYIHYDQGDWQWARETLEDVIEKFPDTSEARLAQSRIERMRREGH